MRIRLLALLLLPFAALTACSTPEERTAEAKAQTAEAAADVAKLEAEYKREKLAKLDDYEACVATSPPGEDGACDRFLRAIAAMD